MLANALEIPRISRLPDGVPTRSSAYFAGDGIERGATTGGFFRGADFFARRPRLKEDFRDLTVYCSDGSDKSSLTAGARRSDEHQEFLR